MTYSVLMSLYREERAERLEAAVESMAAQTVPPEEMVLVCDGPLTPELDESVSRLEGQFPGLLKVLRLPENRGLGAALNAGLEHCKNELVARMDTDDIALPHRMEEQLRLLAKQPETAAVGGQIEEFDRCPEHRTGRRAVPPDCAAIRKMAARRNPMNHMTVTFRKSAVLAAGGYPDLLWFEDYGLWAAMLAQGWELANVDSVCVLARADDSMYRRRSGWRYFRQSLRMQCCLRRCGLCSLPGAVFNGVVRFCGAVLIPNGLRRRLYRRLLREEVKPGDWD